MNTKNNKNADLLSDSQMDEMQKAVAYEIGFKLFRIMVYGMFILSGIMILISDWFLDDLIENKSEALGSAQMIGYLAIVVLVFSAVLYIIYAAMSSSKGIMVERYAKKMGTKSTIILYASLAILYGVVMDNMSVLFRIWAAVVYISIVLVCIFAIRNNKVLKKMESEE